MSRGFSYTLEGFRRGLQKKESKLRAVELISKGCVLYCPLRKVEVGITPDLSGYGNHGKVIGPILIKIGKEYFVKWRGKIERIGGNALQFDGVNDYVDCGNDTSLQLTNKLTVEVWTNPAVSGKIRGIVEKGKDSGEYSWQLVHYSDNKFNFTVSADGTTRDTAVTSSVYSAVKQWYHVVVTFERPTAKIYINGKFDKQGTWNKDFFIPAGNLYIGTYKGVGWYNGLIDEIRIYNRALSVEEIRYHYNLLKSLFR